jgi:hypothetical protein
VIFSNDVLFVHVPKTGSLSVTQYLLNVLPRPVTYIHPPDDGELPPPDVVSVPGPRHQTLSEALATAAALRRSRDSFRVMLAVARNPYELEVSRYAYLQRGHPWDDSHDQELAIDEDFPTFAVNSRYEGGFDCQIHQYFTVDGAAPPALRILRLENLETDLRAALAEAGIASDAALPWENRSRHDPYATYYTPEAEAAVYERYRWLFDRGLYARMTAEELQGARDEPSFGHKLPLAGCARQVGASFGLASDRWAGPRLVFSIKPREPAFRLVFDTWAPDFFPERHFLLRVGDDSQLGRLPPGDAGFAAPVMAQPDRRLPVELVTLPSFCPREAGRGVDSRHLCFYLRRIGCVPSAG